MLTRETMSAMTKEELIEAVETLQVKMSALEKELQEKGQLADIGKKYQEHLKAEVAKFVKIVEGEKSPILKLAERADIETLQELEKEYRAKAEEKLKASAVTTQPEEPKQIDITKLSYKELLALKEKFMKEVI